VTLYDGWNGNHGAILGAVPFSFKRDETGRPHRVGAQASFIVGKRVEVFDGAIVDRGIERNTVLGDDVKVGAGAHIGHDAVIGDRVIVCPGAKVAGYVEIGADSTIGLGACVKNRVRIGARVKVGIGAVVIDDVPDDATVFGNPARVICSHTV